MDHTVKFGVLGLGMGGHHCRAVNNAKGAELVAVCDLDTERLEKAVSQHGCRGYTDYGEMLADDDIDCVNIATESGHHASHGIAAVEAGKHIIVEKPVDVTPAKIKTLEDAVRKSGKKAGCIFQYRFHNANILTKRAIDRGKMGTVFSIHAWLPWFRAQSYYQGPHGAWKGTWELDGGGSLTNQGIHTVDLVQWLAGPVHSVCGFCGVFDHAIEAEDQTVAILRFESGALGTLFTTTCSQPDKSQRLYMNGSKGSFMKNGDDFEFYEVGTQKERERMMRLFGVGAKDRDAAGADPMAVSADGHTLIIEDMVKAIRKDRDPAITIDSAKHAIEIACAIFESSRTGCVVRLSDVRA